jgi:hypothetical protein
VVLPCRECLPFAIRCGVDSVDPELVRDEQPKHTPPSYIILRLACELNNTFDSNHLLALTLQLTSFSQERMTYLLEQSKVIYESKAFPRYRSGNGKEKKVFDALEWLAAMSSHVPNKGSKWSALMATIARPPVAFGKRQTSMT